jgi:hypothetical protein
MTKRFLNAHTCQQGASNERRVASDLVEAIDECRAEGVQPSEDPAVLLITHQLTFLLASHDFALSGPMWERWQQADRAVQAFVAKEKADAEPEAAKAAAAEERRRSEEDFKFMGLCHAKCTPAMYELLRDREVGK